jgi:hypothetical protein
MRPFNPTHFFFHYFFDYVEKKGPNTKVLSTLLAIN